MAYVDLAHTLIFILTALRYLSFAVFGLHGLHILFIRKTPTAESSRYAAGYKEHPHGALISLAAMIIFILYICGIEMNDEMEMPNSFMLVMFSLHYKHVLFPRGTLEEGAWDLFVTLLATFDVIATVTPAKTRVTLTAYLTIFCCVTGVSLCMSCARILQIGRHPKLNSFWNRHFARLLPRFEYPVLPEGGNLSHEKEPANSDGLAT